MTKTTEELKREMYDQAREMRNDPYHDGLKNLCYRLQAFEYDKFESALEAYLEALRIESNNLRSYNSRGHAASLQDQAKLQILRQERDDLRNKLQAFEFANKSAGEMLQASQINLRHWRDEAGKLHGKIRSFESGELYLRLQRDIRDIKGDVTNAENYSQQLVEQLCDANALVKRQRQFIRTLYTSRKARGNKTRALAQIKQSNASEVKCDAFPTHPPCMHKAADPDFDLRCPTCGDDI